VTEPTVSGPAVTGPAATGSAVAGPAAVAVPPLTGTGLTDAVLADPGAAGTPTPGLLNRNWPAPAPGAAPLSRMVRGQAALELRTLARNGEQLLLTLIIPVLLLIAFGHEKLISVGSGSRIDFVVPGILALAVLSTAFTGQAIGTGFERRYGVLKRLGATPLSRRGLIAAKTVTVLTVEVGQFAIVLLVGALLGWRPVATPAAAAWVLLLMLAGTAAFSGLALLMAGTLRAEATLAGANLLYLIMLGLGGVLFPLTRFPAAARPVLQLLPAGALSDGLRAVLAHSAGLPVRDLLALSAWAIVAIALAVRTFRWE
jgi:ABC-2 type transport system permease protein